MLVRKCPPLGDLRARGPRKALRGARNIAWSLSVLWLQAPGQLALSRLPLGSVFGGDSLLLSLSVTEAANHVSLIFICRCFVLLLEGVESERATTNLHPCFRRPAASVAVCSPCRGGGFSSPLSHIRLPRVHSLPLAASRVPTRGHPSGTVRAGRDPPGGLPPGAEKKRRDEEAMLCRAEVSGGKGGRAGGVRKGGEVAPCDLPAAIRVEPHELGLNPA